MSHTPWGCPGRVGDSARDSLGRGAPGEEHLNGGSSKDPSPGCLERSNHPRQKVFAFILRALGTSLVSPSLQLTAAHKAIQLLL